MALTRNSAETIGLRAVGWLAASEELLPVFLGSTGASEGDFRAGLADPAFQGAVLDFILMDDDWVRAFCDACALEYNQPYEARLTLPGGEEVSWT